MEETRAYKLTISGDVQGVFYRHNAKKVAQKLGLIGWVENKQDGTVILFVQGKPETVKKIINWAHEGPPMATVQEVSVDSVEVDNSLKGFEIR